MARACAQVREELNEAEAKELAEWDKAARALQEEQAVYRKALEVCGPCVARPSRRPRPRGMARGTVTWVCSAGDGSEPGPRGAPARPAAHGNHTSRTSRGG